MTDWTANLFAALERSRQTRVQRRTRPYLIHLPCDRDLLALVQRAAAERGLNTSTWLRRAVCVALARQTGLDVHDLLRFTPEAKPPGKGHKYDGGHDTGRGIEAFEPPPCADSCWSRFVSQAHTDDHEVSVDDDLRAV